MKFIKLYWLWMLFGFFVLPKIMGWLAK